MSALGSRISVVFIFITVLLEGMAGGIVAPVFPSIMREFNADPAFIAIYLGYAFSIFAFSQFISAPILGMLSDRFGRRPILLLSLFFAAIDFMLLAIVPSVTWIILARMMAGITAAGETVANAYLADISDEQTLANNIGLYNIALFTGFLIGPAFGGMLSGEGERFGIRTPFVAAAVLSLTNLIFGFFVLPESLPVNKRRELKWSGINPFASLVRGFHGKDVILLTLVMTIFHYSGTVTESILPVFTSKVLSWNALQLGWFYTFFATCFGLAIILVNQFLMPKFGEDFTLILTTVFFTISLFLVNFVNQTWMMFAVMALFAFGSVINPNLEAAIFKRVPKNQHGEISGMLTSTKSLAWILGPLFFTYVFRIFPFQPGMSYLLAGSISVIGFFVFLWARPIKS